MAVTHMLPRIVLVPGADWSQMSAPPPAGTLFDCWIGGLPTTRFWRIWFPPAPEKMTIPFELPIAEFASTMLFAAVPSSPMPKFVAVPPA